MADLKTALILDSRIENITDVESFGVKSSGQNITFQQYAALSASNSLITYQALIPSESVVVDRSILQQSTMTLQINIDSLTNPVDGTPLTTPGGRIPAGANVFQFGQTESWSPFPLTNSFSTIQSSINNSSVSINIGDILPQYLRMTSQEELQKYNSMTPSMVDDRWGMYSDAVNIYTSESLTDPVVQSSMSNPLGSASAMGYDNSYTPRGAFPTSVKIFQYLADGTTLAGVDFRYTPICETLGNKFKIVLTSTFTEPIFLSPFLNCLPHGNQAGFLGINTLTLNFNVNNLQRCVRTSQNVILTGAQGGIAPKYYWNIVGGSSIIGGIKPLFEETRLLCQFLTLQPSQASKIALRNVVEFTDYPRFISSANNTTTVAAGVLDANSGVITPGRAVIITNNLQLNQIPSRFIICARINPQNQTPANTDSFLTITNVSINFNNKSGILASATQNDLFNLSCSAGSSQNFYEFSGRMRTNKVSAGVSTNTETVPYTYQSVEIPTTGSLLVLDSTVLGLEDWLSCSSLGQFNFQMNVSVANYNPYIANNVQVCIIVENQGFFSTIAGSSSITTGVLTKQKVLETKEQPPATDTESYRRFVGGALSNSALANAAKLIGKHYKNLPAPLAKAMEMGSMGAVGAMGSGFSGGASSGGAFAGRNQLRKHFI